MIEGMPRVREKYLHRYHTRHDKFYWYVRRPGAGRVRLRAEYGTPAFDAEYRAAMAGESPQTHGAARAATGSVGWLWERYRETGEWTALKASTRRQRENIMAGVVANVGEDPAGGMTTADILAGRDKRARTPSQAKGFLVCMRKMYRWAVQAGHVNSDPTIGVKMLPKPKGEGFPVWTEADVAQYHARWTLGSKERVWIDVLLYTGLRRGDAVKIGRQHIKDGVAALRTEKGQGEIIVSLPILPVLAKTLEAGPCGDLAFICGSSGKPLVKESFGNFFREACDKAGVFGKSAHGVRKIAATTAADNGATVTELEAIFGWQGGGMAALYTRAADRKRASARAMVKMERPDPICQPSDPVGTAALKAK